MRTDKTWKRFGEVDPYFGVLTEEEYRSGRLTGESREQFFRSGDEHIAKVFTRLRQLDPAFSPARSLDFGCGVGRVAIPLARESGSVLAVDVAPAMLAEARKNARERDVDNISFSQAVTGRFDLVHSFIVFQHIAPRRGLRIMTDLAARVEPGGMLVLQVPYYRDASAIRKLATAVKRWEPTINGLANLATGRPFGYPTMTMFCYKVPAIFTILRQAGLHDLRVILDRPDRGYAGMTVFARK